MVEIGIKLGVNGKEPMKAHKTDAAYDIFAAEDLWVYSGETLPVRTEIYLEIPYGWKGEIYSRSGLSSKGITVANSPGKIDSGYRGEIKVLIKNDTLFDFEVRKGDRIAQLEINQVNEVTWIHKAEVDFSDRGEHGFGSTGK